MHKASGASYFAQTNFRSDRRVFGIKQDDRLSHVYAIGKTGTGKTTLLETLARGDIDAGRGFALIDPHGDLAERVAVYASGVRPGDLVYLNVPDPAQPFGYNPLKRVPLDRVPLAVSGLMEALKKHWSDAWGVRMEHVLRNVLFALLEHGHAKLDDVLRMLNDKDYRQRVADLPNHRIYLKLMIDGMPSQPFSASTLSPMLNGQRNPG